MTFLTIISCTDNKEKSVSQSDRIELLPEPDKDLREKYEQQKVVLKDESVNCNEFSDAMTKFMEHLKQDNYAINIREARTELSFQTEKEEFQVDWTISFPKENFKTIFAKRKNKLERKKDNWYPSFTITEICFRDEQSASNSHQIISEIIDNLDMFNDKNYDYILKNGKSLIYVSCGAKIFEEYAFSYKDKIKEIVKNNSINK